MTPDLHARLRTLAADRLAAVVVIGFVAVFCWATWAYSPGSGAAVSPLDATIRWMGPSNSRSANINGAPWVNLEAETADGRYLRLASDARLVWNCRVGGKIRLEAGRTNGGLPSYAPAPRPCDP